MPVATAETASAEKVFDLDICETSVLDQDSAPNATFPTFCGTCATCGNVTCNTCITCQGC